MHEENTGKQVRVFGELVRSNNSVPVVSADGVYDYNQTDEHGNKKTQEQLNDEFKTAIENGVTISTTETQTSVKLVEGTEFRVEAGTGVKVGKWGVVNNSIEISADTDVLATKTELTTKADKADTYTKEQVDAAIEDVAFLGEDDGQAVIPEFDPQTDTLLKTTQSLTNTEKETVIGNILDKNYIAGSYVGKGKKYLKLNVGVPVATDFDGFVDGATTEQSSLAEVPDNIYFDRTNNRFIASKGEDLLMKYYMSWQNGDAYMNPNSGVYFKNGNNYYQWNGTTLEAATVGNVNRLTQADFDAENTIYVIRYDFDLCGQSITIPEGCVLEFDDGSISNGTIIGQNTRINAEECRILYNVKFDGIWSVETVFCAWATDASEQDSTSNVVEMFNIDSTAVKNIIFPSYPINVNVRENKVGIFYVKSNTNIIIPSTINLLQNNANTSYMFYLSSVENVVISGNGTLIGDGEYAYGSEKHLIYVVDSDNIVVKDLHIKKAGCEGINVTQRRPGTSTPVNDKTVYLYNLVVEDCNRNNIVLTSGNYYLNNVISRNAGSSQYGTPPKSGLDIEPNNMEIDNFNVRITNSIFFGNTNSDISIGKSNNDCYIEIQGSKIGYMYIPYGLHSTFIGNIIDRIAYPNDLGGIYNTFSFDNLIANENVSLKGLLGLNSNMYNNNVYRNASFVHKYGELDCASGRKTYYVRVKKPFIGVVDFTVTVKRSDGIFLNLHGNANITKDESDNIIMKFKGTNPVGPSISKGLFLSTYTKIDETYNYVYFHIPSDVTDSDKLIIDLNVRNYDGSINRNEIIVSYSTTYSTENNVLANPYFSDNLANVKSANYDSIQNNTIFIKENRRIGVKVDDTMYELYGAKLGVANSGTSTDRPVGSSIYIGFMYMDTTLGKLIYASAISGNTVTWVDATGVIAGTPTSGTFANKPTVSANSIPVGFKYFCTDKQTTEGATDGIMIYYKGQDTTDPNNPVDVWVDALGRTIS